MDLKKLMGTDEKQFWEDFRDNLQMVMDYDKAIGYCIDFISKNGVPNCTVENIYPDEPGVDIQDLIHLMKTYFESKQEYEKCAILINATTEEFTGDLTSFLKQAKTVANFDENCDVCWSVFRYYEMVPFFAITPTMDYGTLMTILVNYYYDRKDFKKIFF